MKHLFAITTATVAALSFGATVLAEHSTLNTNCPTNVASAIDAKFGTGTAAITECLANREELKVVASWTNQEKNAKSGIGQQVVNINNMVTDYEKYGLVVGTDPAIVVVGYGAGARWLLSDAAYLAKVDPNAINGVNPSRVTVQNLLAKKVKILMCQNTMSANGYTVADLLPGVQMTPAGVTAVIEYQQREYDFIAP